MLEKIIFAGYGGQGILSAGLMLSEAAVKKGFQSTYITSYGAEMRGGPSFCEVIISDEKISNPIVEKADTLVAFNEFFLRKFLPIVKDDGIVIINSSIVKNDLDYGSRKVIKIPADTIAIEKAGTPKVSNVIMLGVYLKNRAVLKLEEFKNSIKEKFSYKGKEIIELNFKALEYGYAF